MFLYLKKTCTNCSHLSICKYSTVSCLPKLKFYKTKNKTPHIVPLLYSVYNCFKFLLRYESIFYLNDISSFNDFLRRNFQNKTSHSLRRFLPNFHSSILLPGDNTGNWKCNKTMRLYTDTENKYLQLQLAFDKY